MAPTNRVTVTLTADVPLEAVSAFTCSRKMSRYMRDAEGENTGVLDLVEYFYNNKIVSSVVKIHEPKPKPVYLTWPFERARDFWNQDNYWTDKDGFRHFIPEMELGYVSNVLYLLKNKEHIFRSDITDEFGDTHRYPDVWHTTVAKALRARLGAAQEGLVQTPID